MVGRYLVTTADERTWPTDQPVLLLGEWCRLYDRKAVWEKLDAEVVPYHWEDREKLYRDYQYLRGVYEELLQELAEKLNDIHDVDHLPALLAYFNWPVAGLLCADSVRSLGNDRAGSQSV